MRLVLTVVLGSLLSTTALAFPCDEPIAVKASEEGFLKIGSAVKLGNKVLKEHLQAHNTGYSMVHSESSMYPSQKYYYGLRTILPTLFHMYAWTIGEKAKFYSASLIKANNSQYATVECAVNTDYGYAGECAYTSFGGCVTDSNDAKLVEALSKINIHTMTH